MNFILSFKNPIYENTIKTDDISLFRCETFDTHMSPYLTIWLRPFLLIYM